MKQCFIKNRTINIMESVCQKKGPRDFEFDLNNQILDTNVNLFTNWL